MNMGYACINMQLSYPPKYGGKEKGVEPITTGRSMIKKTFEQKGLDYIKEASLILSSMKDKINYKGFIEGDKIAQGYTDVIVADGFTGNVA